MPKQLDIRDTVSFPRNFVFEIYSERLSELVSYMPNIDSIEVKNRNILQCGRLEITNLWQASRSEIPKLIRPFIKPEMLQWNDHATWDQGAYACHWRSEFLCFNGAIRSSGTNYYRMLDDHTMELHLTGAVKVDGSKIPGVPRLLSGKVADAIETGAVRMAEQNLRAMNRGFEAFAMAQTNREHAMPQQQIA